MVSRLYLGRRPQLHAAITADGGWEKTTGALKALLSQDKIGDAIASTTIAANGTSGNDTLLGQWVSEPLSGAQTITGNIKGQARFNESTGALDARVQVIVRVLQSDLSTVRGTLLAMDASGLSHEFNTSLRNITMPLGGSTALSSVAAQDGDRIVVEIGARQHATQAGNVIGSFGDSAASDLAEDETTTTANNPWIEFSQTLTFQSPELIVAQAPVEVGYTPDSPEARFAQAVVEVGYTISPPEIRVAQAPVEVGYHPDPEARIAQAMAEVAYAAPPPQIRVAQAVVEVAYTAGSTPTAGGGANQVVWIE